MWFAFLSSAFAQSGTATVPTAPATPEAPPAEARPDDPPPRADRMTQSDLNALRTYKNERLEVRSLTLRGPDSVDVIDRGWGYHRYPYGPGVTTVVHRPGPVWHSWTVYQGPARLDVPAYYDLVGQHDLALERTDRILKCRSTSRALGVVAALGGGATVTGIVGGLAADPSPVWSNVALGGLGGLVVGLVGSGIAGSKAETLEQDFTLLDLQGTRAAVDAYNEALRSRLGVAPDRAWEIENRR